jgi:cyclophilin family peptidyl-prolyl cis-trans isomerase
MSIPRYPINEDDTMFKRALLTLPVIALLLGQQCVPSDVPRETPPEVERPIVTMVTSQGNIQIELFTDFTTAADRFRQHALGGYWDNTVIHDVREDRWLRLGGYTTDFERLEETSLVNDSSIGLANTRGRVAMSATPGSSQGVPMIHFNLTHNESLDFDPATGQLVEWTIVGRITSGLSLASQISGLTVTTADASDGETLTFVPQPTVEVIEFVSGSQDDDRKDEFLVTDSGLKFRDIVEGTGAVVTIDDTVQVYYTGRLENEVGEVFDSRETGEPAEFSFSGLIEGWREGLTNYNMRVGGTRQLIVPPELAYGSTPRPGIPPNSTLWFEVEILDIVTDEEAQ